MSPWRWASPKTVRADSCAFELLPNCTGIMSADCKHRHIIIIINKQDIYNALGCLALLFVPLSRVFDSPLCPFVQGVWLSSLSLCPGCLVLLFVPLSRVFGSPLCPFFQGVWLSSLSLCPGCLALLFISLSRVFGSPLCPFVQGV